MESVMQIQLDSPEVSYAKLRVAQELFHKPPHALSDAQYQQMLQQVNRELAIARRLLAAPEAAEVVIPDTVLHQALTELAGRYETVESFDEALSANGLDRQGLMQALHHDLMVEAVLERLLSAQATPSDTELEIYYLQHLDKFSLPETRTARHILITINDSYTENFHAEALRRIAGLEAQLREEPEQFASLAQRHSECPTAMQEGLLGRIKPGQLYPALDEALFALDEGEMSGVLESPVGLHLLRCDGHHAAERRSFAEVREMLREHLEKKNRKRLLKAWLQQGG